LNTESTNEIKKCVIEAIFESLPQVVQLLTTPNEKTNCAGAISHGSPLEADRRLNEQQVAELSGLSLSFIQKLRQTSDGIAFQKIGRRVLYRYADVVDWLTKRHADSNADALVRGLTPLCGQNKSAKDE
jgi:hypothetical protein